ncbi:MAG: DMT family transporter [Pseudomonadota bacterium]
MSPSMIDIRAPTSVDFGKLFLLGAIWGSSFLWIELALRDFGPLTIATGRLLIGALVLQSIAFATGQRLPRGPGIWRLLIIVSVLNAALPFFLINFGQARAGAGNTAILIGAGPFVALVMSHIYTGDDRITLMKTIGMMLGFAGVLSLVGVEAFVGDGAALIGQLAVVGAAVSYAASGLMTRWLAPIPVLVSAAWVLTLGTIYMVPISFLVENPLAVRPSLEGLGALLMLSLFATALAYMLRYQITREVGAVFMSQVAYLVPVFGVLWTWIFLGQEPSVSAYFALGLILAGIYVSRLRLRGEKSDVSSSSK